MGTGRDSDQGMGEDGTGKGDGDVRSCPGWYSQGINQLSASVRFQSGTDLVLHPKVTGGAGHHLRSAGFSKNGWLNTWNNVGDHGWCSCPRRVATRFVVLYGVSGLGVGHHRCPPRGTEAHRRRVEHQHDTDLRTLCDVGARLIAQIRKCGCSQLR